MKKVNCRVEGLEYRTCDINLGSTKELCTGEIVKWIGDTCYTLAYWKKDSEGFNLKFIGERPFDTNIDKDEFWSLAEMGQKQLTACFEHEG